MKLHLLYLSVADCQQVFSCKYTSSKLQPPNTISSNSDSIASFPLHGMARLAWNDSFLFFHWQKLWIVPGSFLGTTLDEFPSEMI